MIPKWNWTSTNMRKMQIIPWKPCTPWYRKVGTRTKVQEPVPWNHMNWGFSTETGTDMKIQYRPNTIFYLDKCIYLTVFYLSMWMSITYLKCSLKLENTLWFVHVITSSCSDQIAPAISSTQGIVGSSLLVPPHLWCDFLLTAFKVRLSADMNSLLILCLLCWFSGYQYKTDTGWYTSWRQLYR